MPSDDISRSWAQLPGVWLLVALIAVCCVIEMVLQLADFGLIGDLHEIVPEFQKQIASFKA